MNKSCYSCRYSGYLIKTVLGEEYFAEKPKGVQSTIFCKMLNMEVGNNPNCYFYEFGRRKW